MTPTAHDWATWWATDHSDRPTDPRGLDPRHDVSDYADGASDRDTDREANRHYADGGWPL